MAVSPFSWSRDWNCSEEAVSYTHLETGASRLAIDKRLVCSDFFILSTGVAGDILQKLMNYRFKAAIYGDYSHYASKPLRDFIRESNHGKDFFFVSTMKEAVQRLTDAE